MSANKKPKSIFNTLKQMEAKHNEAMSQGTGSFYELNVNSNNNVNFNPYLHTMSQTRSFKLSNGKKIYLNENNNNANNNNNLNTLNNNAESTTIGDDDANARSIHSLSSLNLMNFTGINDNKKGNQNINPNEKLKPNRKSFLQSIFGRTKKSNPPAGKKRSIVNKFKNFMTPKNDPDMNWNAYYGLKKGGKCSRRSTRRRRTHKRRQN
jgi:hypothetical protein